MPRLLPKNKYRNRKKLRRYFFSSLFSYFHISSFFFFSIHTKPLSLANGHLPLLDQVVDSLRGGEDQSGGQGGGRGCKVVKAVPQGGEGGAGGGVQLEGDAGGELRGGGTLSFFSLR